MNKRIIALFAALLLFIFSLACGTANRTSGQTQEIIFLELEEEDRQEIAYTTSQFEVKKELFVPETAIFPPIDHHEVIIIKISDEQYRLGAFVVSEDASGAIKRIYYNFEVIFMGETYKVESLELFPSEPDAE